MSNSGKHYLLFGICKNKSFWASEYKCISREVTLLQFIIQNYCGFFFFQQIVL